MVACTAMAILKEGVSKEEGNSADNSWEKWKRGGIIGAAALTGGTLMAITGGVFFFFIHCFIDDGGKHDFMYFGILYVGWVY